MKDLIFIGGSDDDLRVFPTVARQRAGYQLYIVQLGQQPSDSKPMSVVGPGCREIRVRDSRVAFRVLFVANFGSAIYVLHCFQKKTQRTTQHDIAIGKERYGKCCRSQERRRRRDLQAVQERVGCH